MEPPAPHTVLMQFLQGPLIAKAVQTVAKLGIADLVADAPRPAHDLAAAAGVDAGALHRILRALASLGVFREDSEGRFANTPVSEALRSDVTGSVRDYAIYAVHDGNMRAWMHLEDVVRTGKSAFAAVNGCAPFEYFAAHPEVGLAFDRAMMAVSRSSIAAVLDTYDFTRYASICDVAGGVGVVLAAILERVPEARGVLFDLPPVIERARTYLARRGLGGCELIGGDMFVAVPAGHELYVLKHILHDWDDERARTLLRSIRTAIPPHGRLLVLEAVLAPGNEPHPAKWLDIQMLSVLDGRERDELQFRALLASERFDLVHVQRLPGLLSVLEVVPV